ncbi:F0F1 ATP synthase subunit epsilon [Saccharibacillus sp. CPCC 101409]|uniref:F0F1 ATP synthase subunit epsilon n=1 Tax=Saccharibacillus sp. CPCC 101409 TaxID=3058041 RepID=UPI002673A115|nr:F0F1 ATP synthase subunit epsilon [Saccharibacillus sp. CPCC 101409]MDO3412111.1 F0F1 ATP synthase subunit epsilon [Saccharibacillus sp. CPCC 101409]
MSTFLLEIVTPERLIYSGDVTSIIAKSVEGDMGVLPGHVATVAPLQIGALTVQHDGKRSHIAVHGGFLEVRRDKVVVLAESAELPESIDLERARAARERAELRIESSKMHQDEVDFRRAEYALKRAMTRIDVSGTDVVNK